jgi:hypothetical protein
MKLLGSSSPKDEVASPVKHTWFFSKNSYIRNRGHTGNPVRYEEQFQYLSNMNLKEIFSSFKINRTRVFIKLRFLGIQK